MIKKAMISQPMAGKTEGEIVATRERALKTLESFGYELVNTFRTVGKEALPKFNQLEDLIGKPYSDSSFMSTSPAKNSNFSKKEYIMEIIVPKGQGNGAYLEKFSSAKQEYEFLLPRDRNFKITGVRKEGYHSIIEMEMSI